jgi:bacterioferritin
MHDLDWALEKAAIDRLNAGIKVAVDLGDNGTRELLEKILVGEEHHADWVESQLTLMQQVGEPNYLAQQIKKEG